MALLSFNSIAITNVNEIDMHHVAIFSNVERMLDSIRLDDYSRVESVIEGSIAFYLEEHRKLEEGFMLQYLYPEYELHRKAHDEIQKEIVDMKKDYDNGLYTTFALVSQTIVFIKDYLFKHIYIYDLKLGRFLNSKGVF